MTSIFKEGEKYIVAYSGKRKVFNSHADACTFANEKAFEAHDAFKEALRNFYAKS